MSDSSFLMTVASIDAIMLQINIDGLPLFKSSNMQFWPILGRMFHKTDTEMKLPKQPFIIGIYAGQQKPTNISEYLADIVNEMKTLEVEGLYIPEINKYVRLSLSSVICVFISMCLHQTNQIPHPGTTVDIVVVTNVCKKVCI